MKMQNGRSGSVLHGVQAPCGEESLAGLFQAQVARAPDLIAVSCEGRELSYAALNRRANQLAHFLRSTGVGKGAVVAVMMERSPELSIALWGILKSGAAYLPLDPEFPEQRIGFLLGDANVALVLTVHKFERSLARHRQPFLKLNTEGAYLDAMPETDPDADEGNSHLAYVLYTSGSTGQPKGCMLGHRAIVNRLQWMQRAYPIGEHDRVLQKTAYTFDVSVWELFWPHLVGARLVYARPNGHKDNRYLAGLIEQEGITVCHFVPSMLRLFLNSCGDGRCTSLRHVFASGEALPYGVMLDCLHRLPAALHNLYGPTEAAVDVTYWRCEPRADQVVPIGRPIDNIGIYLLDADLAPVAEGELGEICIAGVGLADGYLKRDALTAAAFVEVTLAGVRERVYRTGDLGRLLDDGQLAYCGRRDNQVKLRGQRIELGEVEARLTSHPQIAAAAAVVQDSDGPDPKLVAYLVPKAQAPDPIELKAYLAKTLPSAMLPNYVHFMQAFPVGTHGKLDRKSLPWPLRSGEPETATAGRPDTAARLAFVTAELELALGTGGLAPDANLFDLGATSLTLALLAERVHQEYGLHLPLDTLLERPTIHAIADCLAAAPASSNAAPDAAPESPQDGAPARPPSGPVDAVLAHVRQALALAVPDPDANLFDCGATSLTLVQLAEWVAAQYGTVLAVDALLDAPTVAAICSMIGEQDKGMPGAPLAPSAAAPRAMVAPIALPPAAFDPDAYRPVGDTVVLRRERLGFDAFSAILAALEAFDDGQQQRYHYASSGGLNCVQAYVWIPDGGVETVAPGVYYYHPEQHSLYLIEPGPLAPECFDASARASASACQFGVFLIAEFSAIAPLYREASAALAVLEAGYIGQVLAERIAHHGLHAVPAVCPDFDAIAPHFGLSCSHHYLHSIIVGARAAGASGLAVHSPSGKERARLWLPETATRGVDRAPVASPADQQALYAARRQLRRFATGQVALALAGAGVEWRRHYPLRACRRSFDDAPIPLTQLARLLQLAAADGGGAYLYRKERPGPALRIQLYLREGAVEGVAPGLYQLREDALVLLQPDGPALAEAVELSYSPSNRKAYRQARASLFLLADMEQLAEHWGAEAPYLALMEAGALGQLVLQRQAEFGLGVCPIGGLIEPRLRQAFNWSASDTVLHSFLLGRVDRALPAGYRRLLVETPAPAPAGGSATASSAALAVIGLSVRLPQADGLDAYWDLLNQDGPVTASLPEARCRMLGIDSAAAPTGFFFDGVDRFDNLLFNIAPAEARSMDPQERWLLEAAWACFEDAACRPDKPTAQLGKIAVFVGAMWEDYQLLGSDRWRAGGAVQAASNPASYANRLSFFFDCRGPSVTVNTSCSSALAALHLASGCLANGDADAALVGAVNLLCHPYHHALLKGLNLLSGRQEASPFSQNADGWVMGEGSGMLLVKPLAQALAARDPIHVVIESTSLGHTGRTSRYTAPNPSAQRDAMLEVLAAAGLAPSAVNYVEAAAPGASLADAAEYQAIGAVLGRDAAPCHVGSVKGRVGHLESASFLSQLAKVVLQMRHRRLLPSPNGAPRSSLLGEAGAVIVERGTDWEPSAPDAPLRAIVCANGATGTGGAALLCEAPTRLHKGAGGAVVVLLAAPTQAQLAQLAGRLRGFLARHGTSGLADIAYSLCVGRAEHAHRAAFRCASRDELADALDGFLAGAPGPHQLAPNDEQPDASTPLAESDLERFGAAWLGGRTGLAPLASMLSQRGALRIALPSLPFGGGAHWLGDPEPARAAGPGPTPHVPVQGPGEQDAAAAMACDYLLGIFSEASELDRASLCAGDPLARYGINSLMITALNQMLERDLGSGLSKALFYEHQTLEQVAGVLAPRFAQRLAPGEADACPTVQSRPRHAEGGRGAEIAVIGLAGSYPMAEDIDELWTNLSAAKDCITPLPAARRALYESGLGAAELAAWLPAQREPWGGFLDHADCFDPLFFGISPRSAELMDPQARLFLQTAWQAFEDAGYGRSAIAATLDGDVGVFVGVMYGEYQLYRQGEGDGELLNGQASYGSIAHQVSYHLDLRGPGMAVDTMCSASLTALHLAVESLRRGECRAALAGGVNLSIHPAKFQVQSKLGMASSDGRCRSFGSGGDGFVASEGVGAVLLRPLEDALADHDQVYGVILGSSTNSGGKTHGYTVPNPNAQASLTRTALERAGVAPEAISYIEAHGTGTALGDPIEVAGLVKAFGDGAGRQYCAIGSVKSNIGHCESAAGIAGLTKVLLQLRHRRLIPSLHAQEINPNIDFAATPFRLQRQLGQWEARLDERGQPLPRTALVLSFGAGGANACAVVREHIPASLLPAPAGRILVELSADSTAQLAASARRLLAAIVARGLGDADLASIGFTLHAGRERRAERLLMAADGIGALTEMLEGFLAGEQRGEYFCTGRAEADSAAFAAVARQGWVPVGGSHARRISLPTYPFLRERYWISGASAPAAGPTDVLPLVNTSDHRGFSLCADLRSDAFFLRDHLVDGHCVLPGVVHLEAACAAARAYAGVAPGQLLELRDIVWLRPLVVADERARITLSIDAAAGLEWSFRVHAGSGGDGSQVPLSQGRASVVGAVERPRVALEALREQCREGVLSAADVYRLYAALGVAYGPAHQGIRAIELGIDTARRRQLLATVALPEQARVAQGFDLHPSMLDAALQSVIGMSWDSSAADAPPPRLALPFSIDCVRLHGPVPTVALVWVRESEVNALRQGQYKLDIDLLEPDGTVCVELRGFVSRAPAQDRPAVPVAATDEAGSAADGSVLHHLHPMWQPLSGAHRPCRPDGCLVVAVPGDDLAWLPPDFARSALLRADPTLSIGELAAAIGTLGQFDSLLWRPVQPDGAAINQALIGHQERVLQFGFRLIKALLQLGYGTRMLEFHVLTQQTQQVLADDRVLCANSGLWGLMGSLEKEYAQWSVRLVDLPEGEPDHRAILQALGAPAPGACSKTALRHGRLYRQVLASVDWPRQCAGRYRDGGVYVVIGGAGGIGEIWTEYMLRKHRARVIWIGRRTSDQDVADRIARLSAHGPAPEYITADATDSAALREAVSGIRRRHGQIHGVLHAAIVLADQSLGNMSESQFTSSVRAKVDVSVNLAEAFAQETPDFVLFFSSVQSFIAAPGQANYAAGCSFKDGFARQLAQQWRCAVKVVNWGYWGHAGAVASDEYRRRMRELGIGSIRSAEAMAALERLLAGACPQLVVFRTAHQPALPNVDPGLACHPLAAQAGAGWPWVDPGARVAGYALPPVSAGAAQVESILARLLLARLRELLPIGAGDRLPGLEAFGLLASYRPWFAETVRVFERHGLVAPADGAHVLREVDDERALWARWHAALGGMPLDAAASAQRALIERALEALPRVLTGRQTAQEVLFPNASMDQVATVYRGSPLSDYFNDMLSSTIVSLMEARLREQPGYRFSLLEVGAGTGGTSALLFEHLRPFEQHIERYCYTDISRAFLLHADNAFASRYPYVDTALLDIEKPLADQGFEHGSFDFVLSTNALHATRCMATTLRNAKAALKRDGYLCINEIANNTLFAHLSFGLLDGWWLASDPWLRIEGSPVLAAPAWRQVLAETGFHGVRFPAANAHHLGQQLIFAQSDGVILQPCRAAAPAAQALAPAPAPTVEAFSHDDKDDSMAMRVQLEQFVYELVRASLATALKLAPERILDNKAFADYGVDSIIAVSLVNLINQQAGLNLPTTTLFDHHSVDALARHLLDNFGNQIALPAQAVPAVAVPENTVSTMAPARAPAPAVAAAPGAVPAGAGQPLPGHYLRVLLQGPGTVDDMTLVAAPLPQLAPDQVMVSVRAFSLNFADLLCAKGLYPTQPAYPFTPGFDASGVVVAVGSAVTDVAPGSEVIVATGATLGGHASLIVCSSVQASPKPPQLTFSQACALPTVALTVIDAFAKAGLRAGETILIQSAAGGVGLVAIQLARHLGARIFATAGSDAKVAHLRELGVDAAINYVTEDFEQEVMRASGGRGVDVITNTLPGDALAKGLRCLADGGRYVEIAMTALKSAKSVDLSVLSNNQAFFSLDLRRLGMKHPETIRAHWKEMLRLVDEGVIDPAVRHEFALPEFKEAYRLLERRGNIGKVVVTVPEQYRVEGGLAPTAGASAQRGGADGAVAVIGMSGRFARSDNLEQLWAHLANGTDLVTKADRWPLPPAGPDGRPFCSHGSFLTGIDQFDPVFFNISGVEATYMDPQHRLALEQCWYALEDAGYVGAAVSELACGVYAGYSGSDYGQLFKDHPRIPAQAFWGNSGSVLAARISYFLNLQGPALAIDTACSSSLVAVHVACQALRHREIDLGVACGMFIQSTPGFYMSSNNANMLSPTGKCHTFAAGADGFVPGEGGGAVVLKRLDDAMAARDHVHAVIKGSGTNQDGATNGITAPSARSQARLQREVYDRYGINAADIDLVEAHGTGTTLGDPIEVEALCRSFGVDTQRKQYCAIGSIKTNLGHTASSAGLAGLLKLLLALRHRQIPPSLHYDEPNPAIDFANTPFYVSSTLAPWEPVAGRPRTAAVSSFGFSGTNAHLVLVEAPRHPVRHLPPIDQLIVLSAESVPQLKIQAQQLADHCARHADLSLDDVSFTLFMGRRHCKHRLAIVAGSVEQLHASLCAWIENGSAAQVQQSNGAGSETPLALQAEADKLIDALDAPLPAARRRILLGELGALFVRHAQAGYAALFARRACGRVPLPLYPFARKRYWVEPAASRTSAAEPSTPPQAAVAAAGAGHMHPLVHRQRPGADGMRFSSRFSGGEFFFQHHEIRGRKLMPGCAFAEMARVGFQAAHGGAAGPFTIDCLSWLRPLEAGPEVRELELALRVDAQQWTGFEIASGGQLHCSGRIRAGAGIPPPPLALDALKASLGADCVEGTRLYAGLRAAGIDYGPAFQAVERVWFGRGRALAQIALPQTMISECEDYMLHPSILDAALHASTVLAAAPGNQEGAMLAFGVERIEVFRPCRGRHWAVIRQDQAGDATLRTLDVDLTDEHGELVARLQGYALRPAPRACSGNDHGAAQGRPQALVPVWEAQHGVHARGTCHAVPTLVIGGAEAEHSELAAAGAPMTVLDWEQMGTPEQVLALCEREGSRRIVLLPPGPAKPLRTTLAQAEALLSDCFGLIRAFSVAQRSIDWLLVTRGACAIGAGERPAPAHAALHGLFGVAAREHRDWRVEVVDLAPNAALAPALQSTLPEGQGASVLGWRDGKCFCQTLLPCEFAGSPDFAYRRGGVYVVAGGAGGIGRTWTRMLAERWQARVVWLGRRAYDASIGVAIDEIAAIGPAPRYLQADISDPAALARACAEIERSLGPVHGVVHAAVGELDTSIAKMAPERFRTNLRAKLDGTVHLMEAFVGQALDFLLFFSSTASFSMEHGKSSYVASSLFSDACARLHGESLPFPVKVMNWGWWGDIGVANAVSDAHKVRADKMGIGAISPEEGMLALECLLDGPLDQMALLKLVGSKAAAPAGAAVVVARPAGERKAWQPVSGDDATATDASVVSAEDREHAAALEDLQARLLLATLRASGAWDGTTLRPEALAPSYHPWLAASVGQLQRRGLAVQSDGHWRLHDVAPLDALWRSWSAHKPAWQAVPGLAPQLALLEASLEHLGDIVTGATSATGVLFPDSSMHLVEGIYKGNKLADFFNRRHASLVRQYVEHALEQRGAGGLRILEIGAGTGGCTAHVLEHLSGHAGAIAEYCYTDVSSAFLQHARRQFAPGFAPLTCRLLDIEKDPGSQAIPLGTYDIVIACNVLHATADIDATLANVKACMVQGGQLFLTEISDNSLFNHLTFGLLDGWWKHSDAEHRIPGCPGLFPDSWKRRLECAGFDRIAFPAQRYHHMGQQIIVTRSDGIYRRATGPAPAQQAQATNMDGTVSAEGGPTTAPQAAAVDFIRRLVARGLQLPAEDIDPGEPLDAYGLDSILAEQITRDLRALFPSVKSTLLFECGNVRSLAARVARDHGAALAALLDTAPGASPSSATGTGPQAQAAQRPSAVEPAIAPVLGYVRGVLAETLQLPADTLDPEQALASYGLDSILVANATRQFSQDLGPVRSSLLFEHMTIAEIARSLQSSHAAQLAQHLDLAPATPMQASAPSEAAARQPAVDGQRAGSVAIVGLAGRFPMADDQEQFWDNLRSGRECFSDIPEQRWSLEGFYEADIDTALSNQMSYSKSGGFIDGFSEFDAELFHITPREAVNLDPQERLFLQCCWEAIEDAGYTRAELNRDGRRVGVYAGITKNDFNLHGPELWARGEQVYPHTSFSAVANRVSHYFNFTGPSMPVDTMCSSSLTALHIACRHLVHDECDAALAGGVNCYLHPTSYTALCALRMVSSDGKCRSFGAGGDGFVPGEGVGVVLLKRLADAERDGDRILAVVLGSAINHGGRTNGFTVPNPAAQADVIYRAIRTAGVDPRTITYVEAHGTGTRLGDPIEIHGLEQAFRRAAAEQGIALEDQYCAVGSVKSNQGHAESAAGIASLAKVLLQLRHGMLAPSLHAERENPEIGFSRTPFKVQTSLAPWHRPRIAGPAGDVEHPRRAGISSFGAGGANAHVIVEEYLQPGQPAVVTASASPALVLLSAVSAVQLQASAARLLAALEAGRYQEHELASIAYISQVGREPMRHRLAVRAASLVQLREALVAYIGGRSGIDGVYQGVAEPKQSLLSVFGDEPDMQASLLQWAAQGRGDKLLPLWVNGLAVDWKRMYAAGAPRRVRLPTYPFERRQYWLPPRREGSSTDAGLDMVLRSLQSGALSVEQAAAALDGCGFDD